MRRTLLISHETSCHEGSMESSWDGECARNNACGGVQQSTVAAVALPTLECRENKRNPCSRCHQERNGSGRASMQCVCNDPYSRSVCGVCVRRDGSKAEGQSIRSSQKGSTFYKQSINILLYNIISMK